MTDAAGSGLVSEKYGCLEKLELTATLRDLETDEILYDGYKTTTRPGHEWIRIETGGDSTDAVYLPEWPDFVVKRALSEALKFIPDKSPPDFSHENDIPVYLIIDEDPNEAADSVMFRMILKALDYASYSLRDQFGYGLKLVGFRRYRFDRPTFAQIRSTFRDFFGSQPDRGDTMTIAFFYPRRPHLFYAAESVVQIGISDLHRQTIMMAALPAPDTSAREWQPHINGLLLLHELGHLLGAVHVSDLESIMTPTTNWVCSRRFDKTNQDIILAARKKGLRDIRLEQYLDLVAECVAAGENRLVDYPALYFSYTNMNSGLYRDIHPERGPFYGSIVYAVKGYRQLLMRNYPAAKEFFYRALVCDSTQAAPHYYLWKATDGALAKYHLRQAARLGFYRALKILALED